jgi:hypothetical protein
VADRDNAIDIAGKMLLADADNGYVNVGVRGVIRTTLRLVSAAISRLRLT